MNIAAIVTIAAEKAVEPEDDFSGRRGTPASGLLGILSGAPVASSEVLGCSILEHILQQLRRSGLAAVSVISETSPDPVPLGIGKQVPGQPDVSRFWSAWDGIVSQYLAQGVEQLLLLRVGPYVEIDLHELVRFHCQTASTLTQAYAGQNALDMVLVDAGQLRAGEGSFRSQLSRMISRRRRYLFSGYMNKLVGAHDFRTFVQDALLGRTAIQPNGCEVQPGIWFGDGVRIDATSRIESPAYLGIGARVGASCIITGASSIERCSEIDGGTTIDRCCILPGTYVGMGLHVRNALVGGSRLYHLEHQLELQFSDPHLIGSIRLARKMKANQLVQRATSLLPSSLRTTLSTRSAQAASLMQTRWLGRYG